MAMNRVKLPTGKPNLQLRVSKGHYATSHSHINYYIDVTLTKFRLSEARAAAQELVRGYRGTTIIDTILCLDGTEVIGACMGSELTKAGYSNMNAHQTIYVVTPEHTTGSRLYRAGRGGGHPLLRRRACRCDRYLRHGGQVRRVSRGQHL